MRRVFWAAGMAWQDYNGERASSRLPRWDIPATQGSLNLTLEDSQQLLQHLFETLFH